MRVAALLGVAGYLVFLGWLALRPVPVLWVSPANMHPLATIRADLDEGPAQAARAIGAGMLRLAPLGVLLPLLGRHLCGSRFTSFVRVVVASAVLSLTVELMQAQVPSRVADVDSVFLDTTGVALVHLLCYGRLRALARRGGRNRPPPPPATALHELRPPCGGGARQVTVAPGSEASEALDGQLSVP